MFTGIVQKVAQIKNAERRGGGLILYIATPGGWKIKAGQSIATDGVCLSVEKVSKAYYQCRMMPETLSKTTFGIVIPKQVNLELSLILGEKIDGHFVTGHVDTVGKIVKVVASSESRVYEVQFLRKFKKLIAEKGSVAVDGVSLTVVDVGRHSFTISLVKYTLEHTTLGHKGAGDVVNLEFDILARYIAAQTK